MIRLIALDLDGTLLDSGGRLTPGNRESIHAAVAAGIHVVLVTGRSYPFARPEAEGLPDSLSLIVSNGAVERAMDGSRLARRLLDRATAREVLGQTRPHRHGTALIFDRDHDRQLVFDTMDWTHPGRAAYFRKNRSLIAQVAPLEDALVEDPVQVMVNGGVADMREVVATLRDAGTAYSVSLTEYPARDFSLVDVTALQATKGRALAWRAEQLGLARSEVMAVGDNFNDVEMLEFAGTAVVMGNAALSLKERGWHVTGHHDEDGVAQAIARFALG
jgi:Cof subfamily protein (haloacid dehalogenase superfamily)